MALAVIGLCVSTLGTGLGCISGVYRNDFHWACGARSLILQALSKHRPALRRYGSVEPPLLGYSLAGVFYSPLGGANHVLDLQVLYSDQVVVSY